MSEPSIHVTKDGPYKVTGGPSLQPQTIVADAEGESVSWHAGQSVACGESYSLCRCGHSSNKPFCDGTHEKVGFDGAETAGHADYEDGAKLYSGPTVDMTDNPVFCAVARFCDARGKAWSNVKRTDTDEGRDIVTSEAMMCPSGRLIAIDKQPSGDHPGVNELTVLEPELDQSIGLIDDPQEDCGGPLWVRGGIQIFDADGEPYERRNRVTLCRCGASQNKPFCDGTHTKIGWKAE